jgi:hypothetical protein
LTSMIPDISLVIADLARYDRVVPEFALVHGLSRRLGLTSAEAFQVVRRLADAGQLDRIMLEGYEVAYRPRRHLAK